MKASKFTDAQKAFIIKPIDPKQTLVVNEPFAR